MAFSFRSLSLGIAACMLTSLASAQEVTLKVHHFLPAGSYANSKFI